MECVRQGRESDDGAADRLVVEVPPPQSAELASPLLMRTDRREVTIGFDHHQAHPDWPPERTAPPA